MKHGGAMDGAFSHSPQAVRDAAKADTPMPDQETTPAAQRIGGLWSGH